MKIKYYLLLVLVPLLLLHACNSQPKNESKKQVAVSILPQEYFVKQIAGDLFDIMVMIPPGSSPATYEPTPSQLAKLSGTDLYLKMGYTGFELAWMDKIISSNKNMKVADLSEGVDLITESSVHEHEDDDHGHHHGGIDPHIWLAPSSVKIIAKNIHDVLANEYPEHSEDFQKNLEAFNHQLDSLDNYIRESLEGLKSRAFFTYHPSLSYFARDYGLEQYPLELGGKTPSPGHMKYLVDTGKEAQIGVVFLQMQFDQRNAEVLAKEIGAEIVQINPLDPDWHNQMIFITQKLKENLQ